MAITRGNLLAGGGAALATMTATAPSAAAASASGSPIRLAVSTYSYWHLRGERYPVEKVIEQAAGLGFDGVEILHRQMTSEEPPLSQQAEATGIPPWLGAPDAVDPSGFCVSLRRGTKEAYRPCRALH